MMEFDVIVKKIRDFHVIVKNISIVDSLVLTIRSKALKMTLGIVEYLTPRLTLSQKSKMVIAEWMDYINPYPEIHVCNNMEVDISSSEYFNETNVKSVSEVRNDIVSRESISSEARSRLDMILNPTVGIFRKMIEFDSLTLGELDNLTLGEMDYIEQELRETEQKMRMIMSL